MLQVLTQSKRIRSAIRAGLQSCKRPEPICLSQWADENFWLSTEGSSIEGRWETLPFQRAIMNCISHPDVLQVNFVKSARVGYTQILRAAIGYFAEHRARNQIIYQPTDTDAENFMKSHVEPMIRDVPVVKSLAPWFGKKHRDSTLSQKRFSNGKKIFVLGGTAARNFREKSVDNVYYDELSKFDPNVEKEGSPTFLGDKRFELSPFPKSVRGSTPGIEPDENGNGCQITVASRQAECYFRRHVPCPHCDQEQVLKWGGDDCEFGIKWWNDDPKTTQYLCEHCGALFDHRNLKEMDQQGVWRCEKTGTYTIDGNEFFNANGKRREAPESVAFHAWTACNPLTPWPKIVSDFKKTKGDRNTLMSFVNTTLGETWQEDQGEKLDHENLYARREHYAAEIPVDSCVLTAAVDVQDDRFEVEFVAWVEGEESYRVSYERLYGDLSRSGIWNTLYRRLTRQFRTLNGSIVEARMVVIDSGGHYTDEVYKFSKARGVRRYIPGKGHNVAGRVIAAFPRKRNDKGVYLTMIGTDTAKELIYDRLKIMAPGEGYMHYPVSEQFDEEYFKHLTNERPEWKVIKGKRVRVWNAGGRRNEPLDTSVYNLAAIRILQQNFGVRLPRCETEKRRTNDDEHQPAPTKKQKQIRHFDSDDIGGDWI